MQVFFSFLLKNFKYFFIFLNTQLTSNIDNVYIKKVFACEHFHILIAFKLLLLLINFFHHLEKMNLPNLHRILLFPQIH